MGVGVGDGDLSLGEEATGPVGHAWLPRGPGLCGLSMALSGAVPGPVQTRPFLLPREGRLRGPRFLPSKPHGDGGRRAGRWAVQAETAVGSLSGAPTRRNLPKGEEPSLA